MFTLSYWIHSGSIHFDLVASIIRHGLVSLLYLFGDVDNFMAVVFRCPSFLDGSLYFSL